MNIHISRIYTLLFSNDVLNEFMTTIANTFIIQYNTLISVTNLIYHYVTDISIKLLYKALHNCILVILYKYRLIITVTNKYTKIPRYYIPLTPVYSRTLPPIPSPREII